MLTWTVGDMAGWGDSCERASVSAGMVPGICCLALLRWPPTQRALAPPPLAGVPHLAAAAWKASSLSELRWCGDVLFDEGEAPINLPRLAALEIE